MNPDNQFIPQQPVPQQPVQPASNQGQYMQPQGHVDPSQGSLSGGMQPQQPAFSPQQNMPPMGIPVPKMKKSTPWGLIIALIVFILAFLSSSGFAFWAFAGMQDYKNNVEQKVQVAVEEVKKTTEETKEKEFLERSKSPFKKYRGPATFGAVDITYPKTWAGTVDEQGGGNSPVIGYFHPEFVPGPKSGTAFALKVEVLNQNYDKVLQVYDNGVKKGKVKATPFKAERVPEILGARFDGEISKEIVGSAVVLPLRDKTIRLTTMSTESFGKDFDEIILKNFIFTP